MSEIFVKVEDVQARHLEEYARLSRAEYGDARIADVEHLRWKFLDNPGGSSRGVHVFAAEKLIARLVAQPREYVTPAGRLRAAYIVDMLVDPQYRDMAVLLALMNGFKQLRGDFAFVLVTPNTAGTAIWEKFVRLPRVLQLDAGIAVLRPASVAARQWAWPAQPARLLDTLIRSILRAISSLVGFAPHLRFDERWPSERQLESLLHDAGSARIAGVRTGPFVAWRFSCLSKLQYKVLFIYKRGLLAGYVALRRTVYGGFDTTFVVDSFGSASLHGRDWTALFCRLIRRDLASDGPELIMTVTSNSSDRMTYLLRLPFIKVPTRLLSQVAPIFAEWWSTPEVSFAATPLDLTLADCDMV